MMQRVLCLNGGWVLSPWRFFIFLLMVPSLPIVPRRAPVDRLPYQMLQRPETDLIQYQPMYRRVLLCDL